jgi:hypothetical protein
MTMLAEVNAKREAEGKPALTEQEAFKLVNDRHRVGDTDFDIAHLLLHAEVKREK